MPQHSGNSLLSGRSACDSVASMLKGFSLLGEKGLLVLVTGRDHLHYGKALMWLLGPRGVPTSHYGQRAIRQCRHEDNAHVASIFMQTCPFPPCGRNERRVLLVQVMPDWLSAAARPSVFLRSALSVSLPLSPAPRSSCTPTGTYVYEQ